MHEKQNGSEFGQSDDFSMTVTPADCRSVKTALNRLGRFLPQFPPTPPLPYKPRVGSSLCIVYCVLGVLCIGLYSSVYPPDGVN